MSSLLRLANGASLEIDALPCPGLDEFIAVVRRALTGGLRVAAFFGVPEERLPEGGRCDALRLVAVLADDESHALALTSTSTVSEFPSLTPEFPQIHRFEREIYEQWGVEPVNHPWLKPVRFQRPFRTPAGRRVEAPAVGVTDFFHVGGAEVHEVAVGPVHAGVIEPGHFRFQCLGEHVYHLEISLGYQHRGVERALVGGPDRRTLHYVETLAGDTSVGHALAYAQVVEALSGASVTPHARALRAVALELERLANHTGDLGALAGDVAFLPTASYCGRLRGDFLNLTALLSGNRFGRSLVLPGGVTLPCSAERADPLAARLAAAQKDVTAAVELLWRTPSVLARFEGTGTLPRDLARDMGLVGVAARAAGLTRDVRRDFPLDHDPLATVPVATADTGDVQARGLVRWREMQHSLAFVDERVHALPQGPHWASPGRPRPNRLAVSLVEGWRGEICHVALTGEDGRFALYKVVDPSFHNWAGLALALRDQQISDFPLCNKSFNLSYCGQDL